MFQRFHAMKERKESGFTLIELLVVILIIAILAAIAIPVFLNQRKKGYVSQMESAVKNGATAAESLATGTGGNYSTASVATLTAEGWRYANTLTPAVVGATDGYCISVTHASLAADKVMAISNLVTVPTRVGAQCSAATIPATTDWTP